jgi:mRNA interferase YafQ
MPIRYTNRLKRDYKREKTGLHGKKLHAMLEQFISALRENKPLPQRYFDHSLSGEWSDYRDCHLKPDLVLIYRKLDDGALELVRMGPHSELGL